jgi:hypothetical protein
MKNTNSFVSTFCLFISNMFRYTKWREREIEDCSIEDMEEYITQTKSISEFSRGALLKGQHRMGAYEYVLSENPARSARELKTRFSLQSGKTRIFRPHLHPQKMLEYGVFDGKMINDCLDEFPREWFEGAIKKKKLSPSGVNVSINHYKMRSRQSLQKWKQKGWIIGQDERGWFQWYCRYALGRRDPEVDPIQMRRWRAIKRWRGVFEKHPNRTRLQQTLLQWAWPHALDLSPVVNQLKISTSTLN